jgi:nitrogen-specific signal transduction histidine kinase
LTFARKHAPVKQLSQVNTVIEDVLRLRAYEQKVNNIEVESRLAPNLPETMIDHFQMQQVFLNIVVNAEFAMHVFCAPILPFPTLRMSKALIRFDIMGAVGIEPKR